jgi:glycosyltransferase involved in cell wall biosynthesis
MFLCLAGLAKSRSIQIVYPDLSCKAIPRWQAMAQLRSVLVASLSGTAALWGCKRALGTLARQPRVAIGRYRSGRLLYLKTNLWVGVRAGGSIGHIAGVINGFVKRGMPVDLAAIDKPVILDPQVRFHRIDPPSAYGVPYELNLYRFQDTFLDRTSKLMRQREYAFLYQRMSLSNHVGVALSRSRALPLVLEYNGSEVWLSSTWGSRPRYRDVALLAEDMCLKHAHLVVAVSKVLREELIARGVAPDRIVFYPNCIDPTVFDPARFSEEYTASLRKKLGIPRESLVVGFIGTFGQWHGAEVLAGAIRTLAFQDTKWLRDNQVHFLLVGDGPKMTAVRKLLEEGEAKQFCTLAGLVPQQEAASYIAAADILVSPHVRNPDGTPFFGSPTKLFEYMAMGKSIVASALEQVGEVLRDSFSTAALPADPPAGEDTHLGILCPPGDEIELIRGIRFLVKNPRWRDQFGRNCRREALRRYTWDHHVGAILERLESL